MMFLYRRSLYCCASARLLVPHVVSTHQMRGDLCEFLRYLLSSGWKLLGTTSDLSNIEGLQIFSYLDQFFNSSMLERGNKAYVA